MSGKERKAKWRKAHGDDAKRWHRNYMRQWRREHPQRAMSKPKTRRLINPAAMARRMQRAKALRALHSSVELYAAMFAAMVRDGDLRFLRTMQQCRSQAHELLAQLMADVPDLIAAGELEVKDIGEIGRANFAIMHHGQVLVDGFITSTVAWLHVRKNLILPSRLLSEHEAIGDQFTIHAGGAKSWSIH